MNAPAKSFFRVGALERFIQGRARLILPEFVSPRGFVLLWLVLCLVLASGVLAWNAQIPRFATGVGLVVEGAQVQLQGAGEGPLLVAFLPASELPRLRVGQPLFLEGGGPARQWASTLLAIEPQVLSPAAARARFGLDAVPAQALAGPSAVVVARFEPAQGGRPADHLGSVYPVNVRVGARRLLWLLPFVDRVHSE